MKTWFCILDSIEFFSRRAVKKYVLREYLYNLPTNWTDADLVEFCIFPVSVEAEPEDVTNLHVATLGDIELDELDHPVRLWTVANKFETTAEEDAYLAQIEAAAQASLKKACETAIAAHIQTQVDDYNTANGLTLTDVKSCALYALVDGYTHQAFCAAVWTWNVQVWETARQVLDQALDGEITITGPEDALALLPAFEFEG